MMDLSKLIKLAMGPYGLAVVGSYVGYKYHKKVTIKNQYVGAGAGALAGYTAGEVLSKLFTKNQTQQQEQLQAQQQAQLQAQQQAQAQQLEDYADLDLGGELPGLPAPAPMPRLHLSSSPANGHWGEGALANTSYNVEDIEEAIGEVEQEDLIPRGN
jgi:hypothetical protein